MNWSTFKKVFVTFEICFLTFSVYIGSAIYSAGEETVMKQFDVSAPVATLGLTCFVAGYGIGESTENILCIAQRGLHLQDHCCGLRCLKSHSSGEIRST